MNLLSTLTLLEENDDTHLGRLLVLLEAFGGREGTGTVQGLTKLAKLDFLLRYPVYLERALPKKHGHGEEAKVTQHERMSVESKMIRFRYGPWDFRYRRFINLLVAKGLARVNIEGRTITIGLTPQGLEIGKRLSQQEAFHDVAHRARVLKRHFDISATNLMRFIYDTFPEIGTLRFGEEIGHEH